MNLKEQRKRTLRLRSRGNKTVHVSEARDRAFLEQADALVIKVNKRLHNEKPSTKLREKHSRGTVTAAD